MALKQTLPLEYKSLFTPGEVINGKIAGATYDVNGKMITKADGTPYISSAPDSNTLLKVNGKLYMVNHYESLPSSELWKHVRNHDVKYSRTK